MTAGQEFVNWFLFQDFGEFDDRLLNLVSRSLLDQGYDRTIDAVASGTGGERSREALAMASVLDRMRAMNLDLDTASYLARKLNRLQPEDPGILGMHARYYGWRE